MSPDTLTAPAAVRPPHINPQWWDRASWRAKQQAVSAWNRTNRAIEEAEDTLRRAHDADAHLRTLAQRITDQQLDTAAFIESIEEMLDWSTEAHEIGRRLHTTVGALEAKLRRAGRVDLSNIFLRARNRGRKKPCPSCGKEIQIKSTKCRPCASRDRIKAAS